MFVGRVGAILYSKRKNQLRGGRRRRLSEEELDRLKEIESTKIEDLDIKENTSTKLKFRKVPYSAWIMSLIFLGGALLTAWFILIELIQFKNYS
jgi:cell division septal protein FtsQ